MWNKGRKREARIMSHNRHPEKSLNNKKEKNKKKVRVFFYPFQRTATLKILVEWIGIHRLIPTNIFQEKKPKTRKRNKKIHQFGATFEIVKIKKSKFHDRLRPKVREGHWFFSMCHRLDVHSLYLDTLRANDLNVFYWRQWERKKEKREKRMTIKIQDKQKGGTKKKWPWPDCLPCEPQTSRRRALMS